MTQKQKVNQLKVIRQQVTDKRQQAALDDAITIMTAVSEYYIRAYMRGWHDAIRKGERV